MRFAGIFKLTSTEWPNLGGRRHVLAPTFTRVAGVGGQSSTGDFIETKGAEQTRQLVECGPVSLLLPDLSVGR
jgi:hypothetical protein